MAPTSSRWRFGESRADGGADHPVGFDVRFVQRLVHARLVGPERAAALQHEHHLAFAHGPGLVRTFRCRLRGGGPSGRDEGRPWPVTPFMTSLDEVSDELTALTHGAADYIVKPPPPEVLRARIHTHIELKRMRDSPRQRNEALQSEIERRERVEQVLQQTVCDLETFGYSVSHDLRSPLAGIKGFAAALRQPEAELLSSKGLRWLERIIAGARKMDTMIDGILTYSRSERAEFRRRPVDLGVLAAEVVEEVTVAYPCTQITLGALGLVSGDPPSCCGGYSATSSATHSNSRASVRTPVSKSAHGR